MRHFFAIFVTGISLLQGGCSRSPRDGIELTTSEPKEAEDARRPVVLATTTSTHDSGLLDELLPAFQDKTGIIVKTVAVGTGEALEMGRRGEADVLLVHAPDAEKKFVAEGHGSNRRAVMHNDFVVVGPRSDPAGLAGSGGLKAALKKIAERRTLWISRGDQSGTHQKEIQLWKSADISPAGEWLNESGQGMGATLRIASEKGAYTLTDRGTFLSVDNLDLVVLVEGDAGLFNPYHVIEVSHENANREGARRLADYFVDPETQKRIGEFEAHGRQLFTPDALE